MVTARRAEHIQKSVHTEKSIAVVVRLVGLLVFVSLVGRLAPRQLTLAFVAMAAITRSANSFASRNARCLRCRVAAGATASGFCASCGLDLKGRYRDEDPRAYENLGTDWADVTKRVDALVGAVSPDAQEAVTQPPAKPAS